MPRIDTVSTNVFTFDELSDEAKKKARDWWLQEEPHDGWWEGTYEQAVTAAAHLGITIDMKSKHTPAIYFSGFCSQGDGACFEGTYRYKKGWRAAILAEFGEQHTGRKDLLDIGQSLMQAVAPQFYQVEAVVKHRGHYSHSGCTTIDVTHTESMYRDIGDAEQGVKDALRNFMDWIYEQLEREYDWQRADEQVDESIRANGLEFTESGRIY